MTENNKNINKSPFCRRMCSYMLRECEPLSVWGEQEKHPAIRPIDLLGVISVLLSKI